MNYTKKNADIAIVNQIQGLNIYKDSNPVLEYEQLGRVQIDSIDIQTVEYETLRDILVTKAKQQFSNANGLIIAGDSKKAFVIRIQ